MMRTYVMKWRLCVTVAALLCVVAGYAGAEPVVIQVWFHTGSGEERNLMQQFVDEFNQAHGDIQADLVSLPQASYDDQVRAAALSKQLPCVLDLDGPYVANYVWSGYLIPLDRYISEKMKADFLPSIAKQGTYHGKLYTICFYESGQGIWGNKTYLKKAGVRIPTGVDDAWELAEFEDALKRLKALPEVEYPLDLKINYGPGIEWYTSGFSPILQSFGGDLIDRSDYQTAQGVLNGPKAVKAMTWFQQLFKQGYANPEPDGDDAFYGRKTAALALVGQWMWPAHHRVLGDDLVLLPMPKFGLRHVIGMGNWNWGITSSCPYPAQAWAFLEFIHRPENVLRVSEVTGGVPSRKSAAARSKLYAQGGPLHLYVEQLNRIALERPVTPAYPVITRAFADAVHNIIAGADVQTQLNISVQKIDKEIKDNKGYLVLE
jgi:multiple sugar transport system substrate-binding protein